MLTSLRPAKEPGTLMLRLLNTNDSPVKAGINWLRGTPSLYLSSPFEERGLPAGEAIDMPPWGIVTLRVEFR